MSQLPSCLIYHVACDVGTKVSGNFFVLSKDVETSKDLKLLATAMMCSLFPQINVEINKKFKLECQIHQEDRQNSSSFPRAANSRVPDSSSFSGPHGYRKSL